MSTDVSRGPCAGPVTERAADADCLRNGCCRHRRRLRSTARANSMECWVKPSPATAMLKAKNNVLVQHQSASQASHKTASYRYKAQALVSPSERSVKIDLRS